MKEFDLWGCILEGYILIATTTSLSSLYGNDEIVIVAQLHTHQHDVLPQNGCKNKSKEQAMDRHL